MSSRIKGAVAAVAMGVGIWSCRKIEHSNGEVSRNWTPPAVEKVYGVPAAAIAAAIQQRLANAPPPQLRDDAWRHVKTLYKGFGNSLLWLDDKGIHQPRVHAMLLAVADADSDAIRLDEYPLADLTRALSTVDAKDTHPTAEQLADADILLSSSYVALGENLLSGQFDPASLNQSWHINPREERVDSALALTLREDDLAGGLARMRPRDPGYDSLRVQFAHFRDLVAHGAWDSGTVKIGKILKRGESAPVDRLNALRARLRAEGFLTDTSSTSTKYDTALAGAVARFQAHHGIVVDSMLGQETIDAMNVPASYRLAQIAANLERYRWLPRSLGDRYVIVNVPEFRLKAVNTIEGDSLDMKVIVGQDYENKATPVFSDSMEFVVFRPYWNVTPDIAAKEIFPKEAASPGYLAANNMEIYSDHGRRAVRQRPGPKNSLGLVKFLFPNDYNIYLHDTPNDELFNKDIRAFSHGCIRVEKPAELAQWVLGWNAERVSQAMNSGGDNHSVTLPKKIPVYIVYFTTFVRNGELYFGNDLYARDGKLVTELSDIATVSPATAQAQQLLRTLAKD